MLPSHQKIFQDEVDILLDKISPTTQSNESRREICKFLENVLQVEVPGCSVFCGGSFPLKVYLPESDLDIVVFLPNADDINVVLKVFCGLCAEIQRSDSKSAAESIFRIKNIEFVNARVKLAHCLVNSMHIDITINQRSSLASAIFLNEVDKIIGQKHLFKRSLLLIKTWCLYESKRYGGVPIIGSKFGMLSSYAVSVLALYIFNLYPAISHPFHVLRCFLLTLSQFQWDRHVFSLSGPLPIQTGRLSTPSVPPIVNRFASLAAHIQQLLPSDASFPLRCCNIIDPVDPHNNLGISVTLSNLTILRTTLCNGHEYLESLLQWHPRIVADIPHTYADRVSPPRLVMDGSATWFLKSYFASSFSLYLSGTYNRPDLGYSSNTLSISSAIDLDTHTDDMWAALKKFSQSADVASDHQLDHSSITSEPYVNHESENGTPNQNHQSDYAPAAVVSPKRFRTKSEMLPTTHSLTSPKFHSISSNTLESLGSVLEHHNNHIPPDTDPVWSDPPMHESTSSTIPLSNMFVPLDSAEETPLNKKKKGKIKAKRDSKPQIDISGVRVSTPEPPPPVADAPAPEPPSHLIAHLSLYYLVPIFVAIVAAVIVTHFTTRQSSSPSVLSAVGTTHSNMTERLVLSRITPPSSCSHTLWLTPSSNITITLSDAALQWYHEHHDDAGVQLVGWMLENKVLNNKREILFVSQLSKEKTGEYNYAVEIFNKTEIISRTTLQIGELPMSRTASKLHVVHVGSQLFLHINVEGSPSPQLQWRRNGFPIPGENRNILVINEVTEDDAGTYTCDMKNMIGSYLWAEATVVVKPKK